MFGLEAAWRPPGVLGEIWRCWWSCHEADTTCSHAAFMIWTLEVVRRTSRIVTFVYIHPARKVCSAGLPERIDRWKAPDADVWGLTWQNWTRTVQTFVGRQVADT
ncbi:hypothetical protein K402DRAFT_394537 [Aulographum hederae CBS 113979]|uniref:Uncharacterized protein n=1 Tax=Aulographum hederae CBS 113979 TaxID=1176131 RepID=A0A6G1GX78_9PEZI|nr:hypothetical protein K402DRAFT_394537 [Aulographum hederae CBS 113979]